MRKLSPRKYKVFYSRQDIPNCCFSSLTTHKSSALKISIPGDASPKLMINTVMFYDNLEMSEILTGNNDIMVSNIDAAGTETTTKDSC